MKKKYSVKESLDIISELKAGSIYEDLHTINDFLESSKYIINIENSSKYNYLSLKEILLVCFLLEEIKRIELNESVQIKKSIKNNFSFLFEQKALEKFSIYSFASFLRSLTYKVKTNLITTQPAWSNNVFNCDYFTMEREDSTDSSDSDVTVVTVVIDKKFEKLVCDSAFVKKNAGFYFEDVLLYKYSSNQDFKSSSVKEKIAYIVTILLGYDSQYNHRNFSDVFAAISGDSFNNTSYTNMIKSHSKNIVGLPDKKSLGKTLFNHEDVEIIDANSIQHNCGFDFLIVNPRNNKGSIIDLKAHHIASKGNFSNNKISTSSMHFLNSILKVVHNTPLYSNLMFNSIGLFKISWEIKSKAIYIINFELRYDNVHNFKSYLPLGTSESLSLSEYCHTIDLKNEINQNFWGQKVSQNYESIDVHQAYEKIFKEFSKSIKKFFKFDKKNDIVIPPKISLNSINEKILFIEAIKSVVSSTTIQSYPATSIFKDENKIEIIDKFVINGKTNIEYNPDYSEFLDKKGNVSKRKRNDHINYFFNSTLILTILNNLTLNNKVNPKFGTILDLARKIKDDVDSKSSHATINKAAASTHRQSLEDILFNIKT